MKESQTKKNYLSFSDSIAFLLSLTLARKAGPSTDITTLAAQQGKFSNTEEYLLKKDNDTHLEIPGRYWLAYIRGRTGRKQIHDSGNLFTMDTNDSSAHLHK